MSDLSEKLKRRIESMGMSVEEFTNILQYTGDAVAESIIQGKQYKWWAPWEEFHGADDRKLPDDVATIDAAYIGTEKHDAK